MNLVKRILNASGLSLKTRELSTPRSKLQVTLVKRENELTVKTGDEEIFLRWEHSAMPEINAEDFCAFLVLPIAMARGADLFIEGRGSSVTKANCEAASDAWSTLLPDLYRPINVGFSEDREIVPHAIANDRDLMFFSGGVDSTYALLDRARRGEKQDLVTLLGMDYKLGDETGFLKAKQKTDQIATALSQRRHYVSSNAYKAYSKYGINAQLSHVFLLASVGFTYAVNYQNCVIAADLTQEQQIRAFPVGSTFATNRYFDSGDYRLVSEGETVSRAGKLPLIAEDKRALKALSFCKNRKIRPENCGKCTKCIRTKIMFVAALGEIPPGVFQDDSLPRPGDAKFARQASTDRVFVRDAYTTALRSGNIEKLDWLKSR